MELRALRRAASKQGGRYFYQHNNGLQNQNVLYVAESLNAEPRVLLDPNTLSTDGTVALGGSSRDRRRQAAGLRHGGSGSDWQEWHVRDVDTGKDLPDCIKWVKFSGASWTKDGKGFFYSRYDEPKGARRCATRITFRSSTTTSWARRRRRTRWSTSAPTRRSWASRGGVTDDGRYLVISVWQGTTPKNRLFYKDLTQPDSPGRQAAGRLRRAVFDSSTTTARSSGFRPTSTLRADA